jgi:hypothetical protein
MVLGPKIFLSRKKLKESYQSETPGWQRRRKKGEKKKEVGTITDEKKIFQVAKVAQSFLIMVRTIELEQGAALSLVGKSRKLFESRGP